MFQTGKLSRSLKDCGSVLRKPPPKCIDIDRVARFLGVTIVYERIAEDDPDKIGFAADGNTALKVFRNGVKKAVIFPRDYVVLEQFLQHPKNGAAAVL